MKEKKLALFVESLQAGGAEKVMVTYANELSKRGYSIDLLLARREGPFLKLVSKNVNIINFNSKNLYYCLPKLISYFKKEKPQQILSTLDLANLITISAKKLSRSKVKVFIRIASTISIQHRSWIKKRAEKILLRIFYPMADHIIAVSNYSAHDLETYLNIDNNLISVIYNPIIDENLGEMKEVPVNHKWFINDSVPVITSLGRLSKEKDFSTLIKAFKLVRQTMDCRLFIMGEGELRQELESLISIHHLENEIELPGFVTNPFKYLAKSPLFVLPSLYEGLPGSLIQAMACGCQVIGTDSPGGITEVLNNGEFGFLTPTGDSKGLAKTIKVVLAEPKRENDSSWLKQFTTEDSISSLISIISSIEN